MVRAPVWTRTTSRTGRLRRRSTPVGSGFPTAGAGTQCAPRSTPRPAALGARLHPGLAAPGRPHDTRGRCRPRPAGG